MNNEFIVKLGDWSADGHGMTQDFTFKTNKTQPELNAILAQVKKELDIDFGSICEDYEDDEIPGDVVETLLEHGFDFSKFSGFNEDEAVSEGYSVCAEEYVKILFGSMKLIEPTFEYEIVTDKIWLKGIGYGLFCL